MKKFFLADLYWRLTFWATLTVVIVFSNSAAAQYSTSDCTTDSLPTVQAWNQDSGDSIKVYVEDDFGTEVTDCLQWTSGASMTNTDSQYIVRSAMEAWNREALVAPLVYGGTFTNSDPEIACEAVSTSNRPAILVHFQPGCQVNSTTNSCNPGQWAAMSRIVNTNCRNMAKITIYGDTDGGMNSHYECDGANAIQWTWDGEGGQDLVGDLIHELGHALGLPHPTVPSSGESVMFGGLNNNVGNDRHLWPWDMDCVDDTETVSVFGTAYSHRVPRTTRYYWRGYNFSTSSFGSVETNLSSTHETEKGFLSGGYLRVYSGTIRYGVYLSGQSTAAVHTEALDSDGDLDFLSYGTTGQTELHDRYIAPVLMSPRESTASDNAHRANFVEVTASDTVPKHKYIRTENFFEGSPYGQGTYYVCNGLTNCTAGTTILRSSTSLVSGWDHVTGNTMFASVKTDRSTTNHGKIYIHPGFDPGSLYKIWGGKRVSTSRTMPSGDYTGLTDVAPGIACATTRNDFDYNCLIAWVDRGDPTSRILYTYFNVDEQFGYPIINFIPSASFGGSEVQVLSNRYPQGDISAAHFDGKFWIAYKTKNSDVGYVWTTTAGDYDSWSGTVLARGGDVVDPPTWLYTPWTSYEAGLAWTESDN